MNIISGALSFLWRIWFVLITIFVTVIFSIFIIFPLSFHEKNFKYLARALRIWAQLIFYGSGMRYYLHSQEELDKNQSYIIVANHTSLMDIMLMLIVVKQPLVFVGKAELSKLPIFGPLYKKLNIPVDRKNSGSRALVFRKVSEKIKQGKSVCIFPEGGVPDVQISLSDFKDGPFALSSILKVPMVVFTFCGMKKRLPYGYFTGSPGRVDVFLNEIIPAGEFNKKQISVYKEYVYQQIYQQLEKCSFK